MTMLVSVVTGRALTYMVMVGGVSRGGHRTETNRKRHAEAVNLNLLAFTRRACPFTEDVRLAHCTIDQQRCTVVAPGALQQHQHQPTLLLINSILLLVLCFVFIL